MSRPQDTKKIVGIITKEGDALLLQPCDKRERSKRYPLNSQDINGAKEGDVVVAERESISGAPQLKVTRTLGHKTSPGIFTLISIYEQGLSNEFSQAALKQAKGLTVPELGDREDLRNVPLVTVDGADSRDFDDAIFAEDTAD